MMKSVITLAGLVASVMAETSSCPMTTTITESETRPYTELVSITRPYNTPQSTVTETPTAWVTTGTTTETVPDTVYESTCTSTTRYVPLWANTSRAPKVHKK